MDEIELTLNSPITEEQWDAITDVDFDHTDRIWFHTKHGKQVEFIKAEPPTTAAAPPATNADHIREMSDEELSSWLNRLDIDCPEGVASCVNPIDCVKCWLDWLQSTADGGGGD